MRPAQHQSIVVASAPDEELTDRSDDELRGMLVIGSLHLDVLEWQVNVAAQGQLLDPLMQTS